MGSRERHRRFDNQTKTRTSIFHQNLSNKLQEAFDFLFLPKGYLPIKQPDKLHIFIEIKKKLSLFNHRTGCCETVTLLGLCVREKTNRQDVTVTLKLWLSQLQDLPKKVQEKQAFICLKITHQSCLPPLQKTAFTRLVGPQVKELLTQ